METCLPPPELAGEAATERPRAGAAPPTISCVLPCRNEAASLVQLLPQLSAVLGSCTPVWEIVLVDDGSDDDTPALMARWARLPGIRVLQLSRNFGKEAALTAGLQAAQGEVVVTMDADLQHRPALIPVLLAHWRAGADMVYTLRANRLDEGPLKRLAVRCFYALVRQGRDPIELPPGASDFRLMDRGVVDALLALPERNRFMKGLYAWVGFRTEFLPYVPQPRVAGSSSFSLRRLLRLAFTGVTAFSNLPLRIWGALGAVIALCAMGYGSWIIIEYLLYGHPIPGWPTVVVGLMFFSGVQLLSIGIIGEYVGRIFDEVKQRPVYVVALDTGDPS